MHSPLTWRPAQLLLAPVLFALFVLSAPAAQATDDGSVVVPNALTSTEGDFDNAWPVHCSVWGLASQRYQQVYAGTEVGSGEITEIAFRPDGSDSGEAFGPTVISGVTITLATTTRPVDGLSTVFADNVGPDATTVYSGDLTLSSADTGPGPRDFDIRIALQHPFAFDGSVGNLLLDVTVPSCQATTYLDATDSSTGSVSRQFTYTSDWTSPTNDAVGYEHGYGLVTQFTMDGTSPAPID